MCASELVRGNDRDIYHYYNCYFRTALFCFNYLSFLQKKSEKFNMTTIYVTIKHINATKVLCECTHCLFGKHALFDSCVLVIKKHQPKRYLYLLWYVLFSISLMRYCAKCYCFQSKAESNFLFVRFKILNNSCV